MHCVLGKHLDKACQQSNWDRRPLSFSQQRYAALDAEVLLRLLPAMEGAQISTSGSHR